MTDIARFKETRKGSSARMKHRHEVQVVKRTLGVCRACRSKEKERERERKGGGRKRESGRSKRERERERNKRARERQEMRGKKKRDGAVSRILINCTSGMYRGSSAGL